MSTIEIKDNSAAVIANMQAGVERALEIIGGNAETYAKALCPTDTGLLKNSITHVAGGATVQKNYSADHGEQRGSISGQAPKDEEGQYTVYVGTNVSYSIFVELGHRQEVGRYVKALGKRLKKDKVEARPFIRPAIENHTDEYNRIFKNEVKPNQ